MANSEVRKIHKPWGSEELLEQNNRYVLKRLTMNAGCCCSVQYHESKRETVYVLSGDLTVFLGPSIDNLEEMRLSPGDSLTINPFQVHRMQAKETAIYLESSTPELDDVIRLQDEYGRV